MRILVAADDPSVAQVLAEVLRVEGHDVSVARDGVEALNVVETTTVDGVFLDLVMPGLDGLSVLSRIRSRFPDLPVVILSSQSHGGPPTRWRLVMSWLLFIVLVIAACAWIVGQIFRP
jgi:CheY-like chemotaxis protein